MCFVSLGCLCHGSVTKLIPRTLSPHLCTCSNREAQKNLPSSQVSFLNATKCSCYYSLHFLEDNPWIYVQGDSAFCLATTVTDCSPLALLFKSLWERSYIDTLKKNLFWCCLSVKMSPDTTTKMLGHRKTAKP